MATRIDSWIWGIRLTKTRSAAGAACRAGHVQVNGVTAKPATPVAVGDEVRVRLHGHERIVEVTALISKRASAAIAAQCYVDHSPPPPPREVMASLPRRDPGAGRPTKRERRQLDRLRTGPLLTLAAVALAVTLAGCGGDDGGKTASTRAPKAGTGPEFERCGGLTTQDVEKATTFAGLKLYIDNPSVCEWRFDDQRNGQVASFNWYRGSPIGRERGHEQLSREDPTQDIEIAGHHGFLARTGPICEVGVQFGNDFIEISVADRQLPGAQTVSPSTLCAGAKQLATLSIERAS